MKDISFGRYSKFIVAAIGAIGTWLLAATADGVITSQEWVGLVVAVLTAVGVYQVRNTGTK